MVRIAVDVQKEHRRVEEFVEQLAGSVWHHRVPGSIREKVEDEVLLGRDALGFLIRRLDAVPILNVMEEFCHQLQDPSAREHDLDH
jgi:hypothetical protein